VGGAEGGAGGGGWWPNGRGQRGSLMKSKFAAELGRSIKIPTPPFLMAFQWVVFGWFLGGSVVFQGGRGMGARNWACQCC